MTTHPRTPLYTCSIARRNSRHYNWDGSNDLDTNVSTRMSPAHLFVITPYTTKVGITFVSRLDTHQSRTVSNNAVRHLRRDIRLWIMSVVLHWEPRRDHQGLAAAAKQGLT